MVLYSEGNTSYYGGWRKDRLDERDQLWTPRATSTMVVPEPHWVDLEPLDGPVFDQGRLGSCGPNSALGLMQFVSMKDFGDLFRGSRLDLYYYGRLALGPSFLDQDSGTEIRDLMKVLAARGVSHESLWPYRITKFKQQPPAVADVDAAKHKLIRYMRVQQDVAHLAACLAQGYPFVFGFIVSQSFETAAVARTGIMPMPRKGEKALGGHAVMGVGFLPAGTFIMNRTGRMVRLRRDYFKVRNSWGSRWGHKGYFLMPADFIANPANASDFWTMRTVLDGDKASS